MYAEASAGRDVENRAWFIGVAHPRVSLLRGRLSRDEAKVVLSKAEQLTLLYAGRGGIHPLESVDMLNPRPGLRRWVCVNTATGEHSGWKASWASIHHDGSVTLSAAIGRRRSGSNTHFEGGQIESAGIECAIADIMALIRAAGEATGNDEYDVRVGSAWAGQSPLTILRKDTHGFTYDGVSTPLHYYTPVETSVNASASDLDYYWHVHDLAEDCVNQGGISHVQLIRPPSREGED